MANSPKSILGLDVGKRWIGVARASSAAKLAEPLTTIETKEALSSLADLIKANNAETIVVGLPRNLDGQETDQTRWTRQWLEKAKKQIELPFFWQDEALTSGDGDHAEAAARILQDFLDSPESERVGC